MSYTRKLDETKKEDILKQSVRDMPQNPASQGYTAGQIKQFFYKPTEMILELIEECEEEVENVVDNKVSMQEGKGLSTNDFTATYKGKLDNLDANLSNKVDKETGKELSSNDYSTEEKSKLAGIATGANVNVLEKIILKDTDNTSHDVEISNKTSTLAFSFTYTATTGVLNLFANSNKIASIDLPLEQIVQSGTVETCTVANTPVSGYAVGDKYIDFVLVSGEHLYIKVTDLIDTYTASNGVQLSGSNFSLKLDTSNANGLAVTSSGLKLDKATESADGAMSKEDKEKLDNIEYDISNKANIDGYYEQLGAGTAENLVGKSTPVSAMFNYRTAGGTESISDGTATIDKIKGNTVVLNQLCENIFNTITDKGVTVTPIADGWGYKVSGNCTEPTSLYCGGKAVRVVSGHKYICRGSNDPRLVVKIHAPGIITAYSPYDIVTAVSSGTTSANITFYLSVNATGAYNDVIVRPQLFDLTLMYGVGNEPSTVAEFNVLFPNDYCENKVGCSLSFKGTGIKTVGYNSWNGEYAEVVKSIVGAGSNNGYEITGTYTGSTVEFATTLDGDRTTLAITDGVIITPDNGYVWIAGASSDTCLHLIWSGSRNDENESYWTETRLLPIETYFPTGMNSLYGYGNGYETIYDELTKNKAIKRIERVDLGTLDWELTTSVYEGNPVTFFASNAISNMKRAYSWDRLPFVKCDRYAVDTPNKVMQGTAFNKTISIPAFENPESIYFAIRDTDCADASVLKSALSGVYAYYELATPTETEILSPLNLNYRVSDFGTEKITSTTNSSPCNIDVIYGMNAFDTIKNLPTNYVTKEDGKLKLGNTTLTEAQLQALLALI